MPDNSFENKLSRQLEDFKYPASDAVWQKLEENLQKRKKRRWAIIWFFGGLVLLSAGIYFFAGPSSTTKEMGIAADSLRSDLSENVLLNPEKSDSSRGAETSNVDPYAQIKSVANDTEEVHPARETGKRKSEKRKLNVAVIGGYQNAKPGNSIAGSDNNNQDREKVYEASTENIKQTGNKKISSNDVVLESNIKNNIIAGKKEAVDPVLNTAINAEDNIIKRISENPVPDSGSVVILRISPKQSDSLKIVKTDQKAQNQKMPLLFGLRIEAGRSATSESNFAKTKSADMVSSSSTGAPPVIDYTYTQKPSFAWSFGAWLRKPISQKVDIQTGLTYHHYRTRTTQGDSMNYSNSFHLLSVPIEMALQISKGKKLPVQWQFGIEPGWMLGSNAFFKDTSGLLNSDKRNYNRFQLGIQTGISFRFFQKTQHPLELGPVFKYMLTPVFKSGSGYDGHINFLGLRADWKIFEIKSK